MGTTAGDNSSDPDEPKALEAGPYHPEPRTVRLIREALSEKLGRPASARAEKGRASVWVVSDPAFAWIQQGTGGLKGYRSGIMVAQDIIKFYNVHSRALAENLKSNLAADPYAVVRAADATHDLRGSHALQWSSALRYQQGDPRAEAVHFSKDWKTFHDELLAFVELLPADLFPSLPNSGKGGGPGKFRGTHFALELAETRHLSELPDEEAAAAVAGRIVEAAWELFACYYPWEPMKQRSTDLARFMRSAGITQQCEHHFIDGFEASPCEGRLEAAHIKPDSHGGSDRPWNGLWLCQLHHRRTEGRLRGSRDRANPSVVRVRFI